MYIKFAQSNMSITRSKIILFLLFCCVSGVWAQAEVPKVHANKHPLFDLYVFAKGDFGVLPIDCTSLVNSKCTALEPMGADVGLGFGFHMPNGFVKYAFRTGYHYQNFTYTKLYNHKGISLHYLHLDARVNWFNISYAGIQSNVLLSSSLPSNLPQEYLGFNIQCFSPATIKPYIGLAIPATKNLSVDFTFGCEFMIFNAQKMKTYLLNQNINTFTASLVLEAGLTYRIFTTGKRQQ